MMCRPGVVSRPACIALSESASGVLAQHQRPQGAPAYDKHQRSRVSRTTSVSRPAAQELRGPTALRALRPLGFNALSGCALAGLPPALEGFFIASAHGWERGIVAGHSTTGHCARGLGLGSTSRSLSGRSRATVSSPSARSKLHSRAAVEPTRRRHSLDGAA